MWRNPWHFAESLLIPWKDEMGNGSRHVKTLVALFPQGCSTVSSPHSKGAIGFDPSNKSCHCKNSSVSWNFNSRVRRSSCLLLEWSQLQLKVSGWNLFAFRFFLFLQHQCAKPWPWRTQHPATAISTMYEYANVEFEALQHCRFLHLLPKTGSQCNWEDCWWIPGRNVALRQHWGHSSPGVLLWAAQPYDIHTRLNCCNLLGWSTWCITLYNCITLRKMSKKCGVSLWPGGHMGQWWTGHMELDDILLHPLRLPANRAFPQELCTVHIDILYNIHIIYILYCTTYNMI